MGRLKYSALTDKEVAWLSGMLEAAVLFVAAMSPEDADKPVTPASLDRAFAAWLPTSKDAPELLNPTINCVGVQLGEFLVRQGHFAWVIAKENRKTDLAILALPGRGDVLVYPANFVAKRWERSEAGFIEASLKQIEATRIEVEATHTGHKVQRKPWWKLW